MTAAGTLTVAFALAGPSRNLDTYDEDRGIGRSRVGWGAGGVQTRALLSCPPGLQKK